MRNDEAKAIDRIVGANLRHLRMLNNMSQERLGHEIGVTFQQIQKYENGKNRISASILVMICRALGAPVPDLFDGVGLSDSRETPMAPELRLPMAEVDELYHVGGMSIVAVPTRRLRAAGVIGREA